MLQVLTWVGVRCDQCQTTLGAPEGATHYPDEPTAAVAAIRAGWREAPGGWWCSACAVVLACEDQGHEFTGWRRAPHGGAYRYCRRCCLHQGLAGGHSPLAPPHDPDPDSDPDDQDAVGDLAVGEVA